MMNVFYLYNSEKKQKLNIDGKNYTPSYILALMKYMGIDAKACSLPEISSLTENDVLVIGAEEIDKIPTNPGAVILLGTMVGKEPETASKEPNIYGYIFTKEHKVPVFAPIYDDAGDSEVLLWATVDGENKIPAMVKRGENVWDFRFDLAASVWYSGDGFSKGKSVFDFFIGRTPDSRPVPADFDTKEPYSDLLVAELETIFRKLNVPMFFKMPPKEDGTVPDFMLHISGDDDHSAAVINMNAAKAMNELGLPYHINAMPDKNGFVFTYEEMKEMNDLGCEFALHSDYIVFPYTLEGQIEQAEIFEKCLGYKTITNVNHCLVQGGTAQERMRYLSACGVLADNGKFAEIDLNDINAFCLRGFAFGSAFPRFTCDDAEHGNEMLLTAEIPIAFYEPRLVSVEIEDKIKDYLDHAVRYGEIIDFFIHPHYLQPDGPDFPYSTGALKFAMKYWDEQGYNPLLSTTDKIAIFWHDRANSKVAVSGNIITADCQADMLLSIANSGEYVIVDGKKVRVLSKTVNGEVLNLVPLFGAKKHIIEIL